MIQRIKLENNQTRKYLYYVININFCRRRALYQHKVEKKMTHYARHNYFNKLKLTVYLCMHSLRVPE